MTASLSLACYWLGARLSVVAQFLEQRLGVLEVGGPNNRRQKYVTPLTGASKGLERSAYLLFRQVELMALRRLVEALFQNQA